LIVRHPDLHSFPTRRSSDLVNGSEFQQLQKEKGSQWYQALQQTEQDTLLFCSFDISIGSEVWPTRKISLIQRLNLYQRDGCEKRSEEHTSELQSRFDLVCRL